MSPHNITIQFVINTQNIKIVGKCLCDDHSVEWIAVVEGKSA